MFGPFTDGLALMGLIIIAIVLVMIIWAVIDSAVTSSKNHKARVLKKELDRRYDEIGRDLLEGRISADVAAYRVKALALDEKKGP